MPNARRGASTAVQRVLNERSGADRARTAEAARCPLCEGGLRFTIGSYGQTLEYCETRQCANAVPHHPMADPNAESKPAFVARPRHVKGAKTR